MLVCLWISVGMVLVATASCVTGRPPAPVDEQADAYRALFLRGMKGGLWTAGLLLAFALLTSVRVVEVACWAAAAAGVAEASWLGLMWLRGGRPDDGWDDDGGDDEPGPPPPGDDEPTYPWDDFDRVRGEWDRPLVSA